MKRVTGIGGVFFRAKDAPMLREWYRRHLGIDVQAWGGAMFESSGDASTNWCINAADNDYFAPGTANFMINYRVEDLHALVKALREEGCNVQDRTEESEFGKFAWVIDPEGNKVELWEPPA